MRELVALLARAEHVLLDLHVAGGVPLPHHLAFRGDFLDVVAVHAAVGVLCTREAARNALLDLRRHDFPGEKDRIAVR